MEYAYKGYEVSLDIKIKEPYFDVHVEAKKCTDGEFKELLVEEETFSLTVGLVNAGLGLQKRIENKIDSLAGLSN